jgi:ribosomal protein L17
MTESKRLTAKKIEIFLSKLAEMAESLPTQEMKEKTNEELEKIINFLLEFQERMKNVPTLEETKEISSTVERLITLVKVAESDPLLSKILGLSVQKADTRPKSRSLTDTERSEAKKMAAQIKELSSEEVRNKLGGKSGYKVAFLRQVAQELGIKVNSKTTKMAIIEKISKKISNIQGYDYLRKRESEEE